MSPSRRNRHLLLAGVAAVALSSCVQPNEPGIAIRALQSDIVFGLPAPVPDAIPSLAAPPISFDEPDLVVAPQIEEDEEPEYQPTPVRPRAPIVAPPAVNVCPDAAATAFPKDAASFGVTKTPASGTYKWKRTISTPVPDELGGGQSVSKTVFRHQIGNVSEVTETANPFTPNVPTTTFTYDDTSFFPNGSSTTTTYQVKNNAPRQVVQGNQNFGGGVAAGTGQSLETGTPDRGVAILKTVLRDPNGKEVSTFEPSPPVLILPLDVVVPSTFSAVGVDPTSGSSLAINGQIVGRERVDACGEIIDGWKVSSTQSFTSATGDSSVLTTTYHVGTQLGGLVILEAKQSANPADSATGTIVDNIGQLVPDAT